MLNTTNNQTNLSLTSLEMQQKLQDRRVFEQFLNKTNRVTCDKPKAILLKKTPLKCLVLCLLILQKIQKI